MVSGANPWTGRRILVTGGTGLIGSSLVRHLASLGTILRLPTSSHQFMNESMGDVEWVGGDLADTSFCNTLMKGVDHVIHLASFRRNVAYHREHRDEVIDKNLRMTDALARALTEEGRPIPVTFFSTALLGTLEENAAIDDVTDGYMAAKMLCEKHWYETCADLQSPLLIVRPVSAYGPGDNAGKDANVIPSLIKRCLSDDVLTVWGSGKQTRPFLFAPDVTMALMRLLENSVTGMVYMSPPESVSIRALATMIRDIAQPGLPITFDTSKPDGPSFPELPVHPRMKDFAWTELRHGLQETIDWYKEKR